MKKLGKKDRDRIKLRWLMKYDEFIKMDKEVLKKLYIETKMSSTDRHALTQAVQEILYKESLEIQKENIEITKELDAVPLLEEVKEKKIINEGKET